MAWRTGLENQLIHCPKRYHGIELLFNFHSSCVIFLSFSFSFFLILPVIFLHLNTMDVGFDMYQTQ
jgi:hypothetical protein